MVKYRLVKDKDSSRFEEEVNVLLSEGYEFRGKMRVLTQAGVGAHRDEFFYVQQMVKSIDNMESP